MRELTVQVSDNQLDMPFDFSSLGTIDNAPFVIEDIKKNYSIRWGDFNEVIDIFKDTPLENHIEQHTELLTV